MSSVTSSFSAIRDAYGYTLDKSGVARVLRCKPSSIDSASAFVLPRIKGKGGSSPLLFLAPDVGHFLDHRGEVPPLSGDEIRSIMATSLIDSFGETMTRDEVAMLFHVAPVTISRSNEEAFKPVVEARGRIAGAYSTFKVLEHLLLNRVDSTEALRVTSPVTPNVTASIAIEESV